MEDCLFCKIIKGEVPSTKVYEDENVLAFNDLYPDAPIHILVIPKKHIESMNDISEEDELLIGKIHTSIKKIAEQEGFADKGYRIKNNCGKQAGQVIMHLHFHVLSGFKD